MYYGQKQEDKKIRELLGESDPGFYIDVGAYHAEVDSVTKHFYDRGWHGINVEPVQQLWRDFYPARPRDISLNCAIGQKPGRMTMKVACNGHKITGLSSLHKSNSDKAIEGRNFYEQEVEIYTLENICDTWCNGVEIDFLKIDVEGFEKEVIYSGNWARYRPKVLCIEATMPCTEIRCDDQWRGYVEAICKYRFDSFDGLNCFFTRNEKW